MKPPKAPGEQGLLDFVPAPLPRGWVLANLLRPSRPGLAMTKQKTHKGVFKRMKLTKSGKVKRRKSFTSHILVRRSRKRKRHLRAAAVCPGKIGVNMAKALGAG